MINWERVEAVLRHLAQHPEEHDQATWGFQKPSCGTVACMAGRAVMLFAPEEVEWVREDGGVEAALTIRGEELTVPWRAAELLGLRPGLAEALFYDATDLDDILTELNDERSIYGLPPLELEALRNQGPAAGSILRGEVPA